MRNAVVVLVLVLAGCTDAPEKEVPTAAGITLMGAVEFQIGQRDAVAVPGSSGKLLLMIDDITGGQVRTTVLQEDWSIHTPSRSMKPGDKISFCSEETSYTITLLRLKNTLVGTDYAYFEIAPTEIAASETESTDMIIEALIASLDQLSDAQFMRNGTAYSAQEAMDHMRQKWNLQRERIHSPEDFIRNVATKSIASGNAYQIRLSDGSIIPTAQWLEGQLERIRNEAVEAEETGT